MCAIPIRKEYWNLQPEDVVPQFILYKQASGLSERTITDYQKLLRLFFTRFDDALEFPRERTMEFLASYKNPCSYNIYYAYLKCFWDWTQQEGFFKGDRHPLDGLHKRKPRGRIVQLEEREVASLLSQPDKSRFTGFRDYCLMCLQLDTAIRPGEALQLMPEDFSADRKEIIVRAEVAKTRTQRVLPLSDVTVKGLMKMIMLRPSSWKDAPLLPTETGTPFEVASWSRRVKSYGKKTGLDITAYSLRHAAALLLLRKGANAFCVQNILGHATMQMTKHYLALTTEDTKKGHDNAAVLFSILGNKGQARQRITKI